MNSKLVTTYKHASSVFNPSDPNQGYKYSDDAWRALSRKQDDVVSSGSIPGPVDSRKYNTALLQGTVGAALLGKLLEARYPTTEVDISPSPADTMNTRVASIVNAVSSTFIFDNEVSASKLDSSITSGYFDNITAWQASSVGANCTFGITDVDSNVVSQNNMFNAIDSPVIKRAQSANLTDFSNASWTKLYDSDLADDVVGGSFRDYTTFGTFEFKAIAFDSAFDFVNASEVYLGIVTITSDVTSANSPIIVVQPEYTKYYPLTRSNLSYVNLSRNGSVYTAIVKGITYLPEVTEVHSSLMANITKAPFTHIDRGYFLYYRRIR